MFFIHLINFQEQLFFTVSFYVGIRYLTSFEMYCDATQIQYIFENVYFYDPANHLHSTGNQYNEGIFSTAYIQEECEI